MADQETGLCPGCDSERVVPGSLASQGSRGPLFTPDDTRTFFPTMRPADPHVSASRQALVRLDCGLLWSAVDLGELHATLQVWALPSLKRRLGLQQTSELTPSAAPTGRGDEPSPTEERP